MTPPPNKHQIIYSKNFKKEFAKLPRNLQILVMRKLHIMESNLHHPSLRTKQFKDKWESSVNMDIRLFWRYGESDNTKAMIFDVGHHDIIKNYNKRKK